MGNFIECLPDSDDWTRFWAGPQGAQDLLDQAEGHLISRTAPMSFDW